MFKHNTNRTTTILVKSSEESETTFMRLFRTSRDLMPINFMYSLPIEGTLGTLIHSSNNKKAKHEVKPHYIMMPIYPQDIGNEKLLQELKDTKEEFEGVEILILAFGLDKTQKINILTAIKPNLYYEHDNSETPSIKDIKEILLIERIIDPITEEKEETIDAGIIYVTRGEPIEIILPKPVVEKSFWTMFSDLFTAKPEATKTSASSSESSATSLPITSTAISAPAAVSTSTTTTSTKASKFRKVITKEETAGLEMPERNNQEARIAATMPTATDIATMNTATAFRPREGSTNNIEMSATKTQERT